MNSFNRPMAGVHDETIYALRDAYKDYDELTGTIQRIRNRWATTHKGISSDLHPLIGIEDGQKGLESLKGKASRLLAKHLKQWPLWTEWLEKVPGVGPSIASPLILAFYYRFMPVCQECGETLYKDEGTLKCPGCGKAVKGEGVLTFVPQERDFATVSKWRTYCGRHVIDDKMPKRKAGQVSNWSTKLRTTTYMLSDQFNRQTVKTPYGRFLLDRKAKALRDHPDITAGHRLNMAKHEAACLFLSHFWHVARELDGKSTEGPYAEVILGHTGIIAPYHWGEELDRVVG